MTTSFFQQANNAVADLSRFESINQSSPSASVSEKYTFIPTRRVLAVLADYGWFPAQVVESQTRKADNKGFQKHAIRLSNARLERELEVGGTLPQILLSNSHCGSAAFCMSVALFEKVCSNGLVVERGSALDSLRVTHRGYADQVVESSVQTLAAQLPSVLARAEEFKSIVLERSQQRAFASAALELRFDGDKYLVEPDNVLRVRHHQQSEPTLWNTYNVVQSNLIKGGVRQRKKDGSRRKSRPVKAIDSDIKLNRALWKLTEKMAELKS
jgi:hypothetical protein